MSKIDELLKNEKVEWKKIGEIKEVKVISPKRKIKKNEYLSNNRSRSKIYCWIYQ